MSSVAMAVELHGREPLLPSQFFTEDDFVSEKNKHINNKGSSSGACFAWDVPNRVASCGSGLIEMENEEDDCIAELTHLMAQSHFLLQEDEPDLGSENPKLWGFTDWPQSTLWSPLDSNHGTPRGTPPPTAVGGKGGTWDLFSDASGIKNDGPRYHDCHKLPATSLKSSLIDPVKNPKVGFNSNQDFSDDHLRAFQFDQLKQQQIMKQNRDTVNGERRGRAAQEQQSKGRTCGGGFGNTPTWAAPPQQPPTHKAAGSGMRTIFLAGSDSRKRSCGTGVFLPRGIGNPSDSRKKQGCSTVLIPARVAQALKLNFDEMGVVSSSLGGRFSLLYDAAPAGRRNGLYPPQKRRWPAPAPPAIRQQEMGVYQGWSH